MNGLAVTLALVAGGATLVGAAAAYTARRLLVMPRPVDRPAPTACAIPYEDVSFPSAGGVAIRGWLFAYDPAAPSIIYCPGRGRGLDAFDFRYAAPLHAAGYNVLMFDWRGMGASSGQSSMGYWEQYDLLAAIGYLRRRGMAGKIGALGTSLGAAVIYLAAGQTPELAAVAGECGFATYQGMVRDAMIRLYRVPNALARPLAWLAVRLAAWRRRFPLAGADPVRAIGRISPRPVLVIHGETDRHVPVAAAHALYDAARQPKELWLLPGVAHTQGLDMLGADYSRRVVAFFDHWLKEPA